MLTGTHSLYTGFWLEVLCIPLVVCVDLMHGTLLPFAVTLNANRHVTGVLRGFDQFMNIVLDNAVDEKLKTDIGMVVRSCIYCLVVKLHFTA